MTNTYLVEGNYDTLFIQLHSWEELYNKLFSRFSKVKDECEFGWKVLQETGYVKISRLEISKIVGYVIKRFDKNKSLYLSNNVWQSDSFDFYTSYDLAKKDIDLLNDENAFILPLNNIRKTVYKTTLTLKNTY